MRWPRSSPAPRARPAWLPDAAQALTALAVNSTTSFVAGATLGAVTGTFERLPGLLVLVPAAIGLRGNVFSALGSRLSTSVHAGTFSLTARRGSIVAENVLASLLLTSGLSLALAVAAAAVGQAVLPGGTIAVLDLATISIAGGILASLVVLVATMVLARGAANRGWDLDNLVAPVVSTLGDVITIPSLLLATGLVDHGPSSTVVGVLLVAVGAAGAVYGLFSREELLRTINRQSWPILLVAGVLSLFAGVVIEHRLADFAGLPALLVLVPAFVSSAGALGGILASRTATGLHLGTRMARLLPDRATREDIRFLGALAVPVMVFNAVGAHLVARLLGQASPGLGEMVLLALLAGAIAVSFVFAVATMSAVGAVRLRLDPDTYGIPLVTSSVDFVGAAAISLVIGLLGLT